MKGRQKERQGERWETKRKTKESREGKGKDNPPPPGAKLTLKFRQGFGEVSTRFRRSHGNPLFFQIPIKRKLKRKESKNASGEPVRGALCAPT